MEPLSRRESFRALFTGLLQTAATVLVARTVVIPSPAQANESQTERDLESRADQVVDLNAAPGAEATEEAAAFLNGAFRNGGGFANGGFRNGGFANGGFRNGGFANGGWPNGGFRNGGWLNGGWPNGGWRNGGWRN